MENKTAPEQIDDIMKHHGGWKAHILAELRTTINHTDSRINEEVKWKMPSRPQGLPVWSYKGILCFAEIWKDNVKLLFPKGAKLTDPNGTFNARLKSKEIRAIEFKENDSIDRESLIELVQKAIKLNIN